MLFRGDCLLEWLVKFVYLHLLVWCNANMTCSYQAIDAGSHSVASLHCAVIPPYECIAACLYILISSAGHWQTKQHWQDLWCDDSLKCIICFLWCDDSLKCIICFLVASSAATCDLSWAQFFSDSFGTWASLIWCWRHQHKLCMSSQSRVLLYCLQP